MTDREKLVDALRGNIEYELRSYPDDNYVELVFNYDAIVDALIAAGFVSLKKSADMARGACDILRNIKDDEIKCICKEKDDLARRAEVVERAYDNIMGAFHELLSAIFPDKKIDIDEWKKDNLANAEKELAEEDKK